MPGWLGRRKPHPDVLYLREAGRWSAMHLDARNPTDVALSELLGLVPAARRTPRADVDVALVLDPVLPLVLWHRRETLGIVPPGGPDLAPLTADHLQLLDVLVRRTPLGTAAERLGWTPARVHEAARRLDELGAVAILPAGTSLDDAPPHDRLADAAQRLHPRSADHPALAPPDPDRIPVVAAHQPRFGPPLALGLLLAHARAWEGGRLEERYELRRPVTHDEARIVLADHRGPGVLLLSNYVWSFDENAALAADLKRANPELVVVHGGPHTPKYEGDEREFFARVAVDVAVRGEGEATAVELLDALAGTEPFGDRRALAGVDGLTYRDPTSGEPVRNPDRDRITDLDQLPSPYLTGEFDDLHPASWDPLVGAINVFETNRGCPYKCSFCDWGSSTMSRIRKFSMERVTAEMDWLADRDLSVWMVADANYGILPRDVEITEHMIALRRARGVPAAFGVNTAKNSTKNLARIVEALCDEGITAVSSLALQTRDPDVLEAIDRTNISVERYDALAVQFRRHHLPILCDLIVGLPGATVASLKADLQWCFDTEITPRAWVCQVLPNAPMNAPEYRERFALETDEHDVVVASSSFDRADRDRMMRLRMGQRAFEHLGLLRHVLRYLQWDHDLPAMDVVEQIAQLSHEDPQRYPLLSWTMRYLDLVMLPPAGWRPFYDEVRRFAADELAIADDPGLETVLAVQLALMPDRRRRYPIEAPLAHDYLAYHREATTGLYLDGSPSRPSRRLVEHGPGTLPVWGDPARVPDEFRRIGEDRDPDLLPGKFWHINHFELDSPLTRWVAEVRATPGFTVPESPIDDEPDDRPAGAPEPVALRGRAS